MRKRGIAYPKIYERHNGVGTQVQIDPYKINGIKFADGSDLNFSDSGGEVKIFFSLISTDSVENKRDFLDF